MGKWKTRSKVISTTESKFIPKKTVFNFNYLFFILSIQMITTIIAVDLGAVFGLIEVKPLGKTPNYPFEPEVWWQ